MPLTDHQYDVSPQEKENILKRAALRQSLKEHFTKGITDPHRFATGDSYFFDPGVQRFLSMRVTRYDYFYPTVKGFFRWFGMVIVPVGLYAWVLTAHRNSLERKYRSGEIAYKDRAYKFST